MDAEIPIGFVPVSFCRVRLSTYQNIPTGVWTLVHFDVCYYDNNNEFNTTTWTFKPKVTGYYHIDLTTALFLVNYGCLQGLRIFVDGVSVIAIVTKVMGGDYSCLLRSGDIYLLAGQIVQVSIFHNDTAERRLVNNLDLTCLNIHRFA